jgi:DNA-binding CsgD family transcriptional regulator
MAGARSAAEVPILRGRQDELAAMDGLLAAARAGRSGVLVLRGDAGIGKTALLEHAIASASDVTLLRAVGVESEMELPFAALHQLCAPVDDFVDRLPAPQRDALEVTFGVSAGAAPDRFLVALATLSLFSDAAQERPLLCVIDDAQWLDRASAQALAFVARRLLAEPVVLLFAARETTDAFADLSELLIEGVDDAEARRLLASVIPGRLDDRVVDQLVAEARGNPLALLELPRGLAPAQLAGGFGLPGALSLTGTIEQSFLQRLEALPEDTQELLLVAAAEPLGDPALLSRAAQRLGIAGSVLEPAESAGLIEIDGRVRFRHPLVRSAVYRAASAQQRRRVHRALAEATDAATDPDRRAWHLASATAGPDEDVASELERAAGRAQARGGLAAAAAFLERAVELTVEPSRRAGRALTAAQTSYEAGALDDALSLLATAEAAAPDKLQRARLSLLGGQIALASRRGSDAPPLLLKAAGELEAVDPALARVTYLEALLAARFAGPLARGAGIAEVSQAALAAPPPQRPRPPDLLLQGFATGFTQGHAAGAPILKEALRAFRDETDLPPEEARWLSLACWAAADLWDHDTWTLLTTRQLQHARDVGALRAVPLMVSMLSYIHATAGELAAAESLLDELRAVTEATGMAPHHYVALWVAALRGREPELSALIDPTAADAVERGEGFTLLVIDHVSAVLYNGLGRYEEAMAALRRQVIDPLNSDWSPRPMAELIEAAVRCGERALAERALQRLVETTCASGTEWGLGVQAGSRALLSDGGDADGLYRESIDRLGRTRLRVQLARAHLMYGEWLRRERRRLDAREQLRTAHEMFAGMGTEGFAARAGRELLATGERARRRTVETREELTAQEAQVARLARDGLSNSAIGERLFISQHTVAYHLRKVFTKLDITSRNQLGRALPRSSDPAGLP